MNENMRLLFLDTLENEVLTEENTDKLIDAIFDRIKLPWYVPTAVVKRVLDRMLPDVLLEAIKNVV